MTWFKKKEEEGGLKLTDYKQIWSKFCFLDESGSLNDQQAQFFTVGLIKCSQPHYLNSKILYLRHKSNFYDEMKFNKLSRRNLDFAKLALDAFFSTRSINFYSYTLDKQGDFFQTNFGGDPWKAYEDISIRVIKAACAPNEIVIVIADHITTPKTIHFEVVVKRKINETFGRLAIAGVCRFDSKGNDILQVVDLMIGAINYNLKMETGIINSGDKYKKDFLDHFKKNLGATSFILGFRSFGFNIFVDRDMKQRLPLPVLTTPDSN